MLVADMDSGDDTTSKRNSQAVALIGMSCRFPGSANSPEKFWSLLYDGKDTWSEVPRDRFTSEAFYHPNGANPGTTNHRGGHFLDTDVAAFDAAFFGIPAQEAHSMDPQQRLLLETTYEALENAGLPLEHLRGSKTAVYAAVFNRDYDRMLYKDIQDTPKYHMTGTGDAILSNRISYLFDLKGPSMTLDTGCSGSLIAIHQACQSLKTHESDIAIAGGVNLMLTPDVMSSMSNVGVLNADGKCYTFDSRGSGYGRGEGSATVILKRLDDALVAGDPVRCIVKDTGANQDGKTNGIFQPSATSQAELMRSLYARNGLDTSAVSYVEIHGTGTVAGDAAELDSIADVFGPGRGTASPLLIGSLKPNIGHLEAASGIAGLIKCALMLNTGLVPANINVEKLKDGLNLCDGKIQIPRSVCTLPKPTRSARQLASINSFGYGGTNAHCILESVHPAGASDASGSGIDGIRRDTLPRSVPVTCAVNGIIPDSLESSRGDTSLSQPCPLSKLIVITAHSETSLVTLHSQLRDWTALHTNDLQSFTNLAYTLSLRRSLFAWRSSFIADSCSELNEILTHHAPRVTKAAPNMNTTFVFTGQGAQWYAMGRELIHIYPAFKESLCAADAVLKHLSCPWTLLEELQLNRSESRINEGTLSQPATTAIQIALVDLLESFEVSPTAVIGHSSGEIAASYAAGILTRSAAIQVAYHRGIVTQDCRRFNGGMIAIGLDERGANEYLAQVNSTGSNEITIACINSPSSTTVSGDGGGIDKLQELLEKDQVFYRRLEVDVAYHSHHMQRVSESYYNAISGVEWSWPKSSVMFFSTVTAAQKYSEFGASYWTQNLVSPVQFKDALEMIQQRVSEGADTTSQVTAQAYLEIGPHKVLEGAILQTLGCTARKKPLIIYAPCLVRFKDAVQTFLEALGRLFEVGLKLNLQSINRSNDSSAAACVLQDLPCYPWNHQSRFWHEPSIHKAQRQRRDPAHDLLGIRVANCPLPIWRHTLNAEHLSWLCDHVVDGFMIFPAAGYLCMAIEAIIKVKSCLSDENSTETVMLRDIEFVRSLTIPSPPESVEVQICLTPPRGPHRDDVASWHGFEIFSMSTSGSWSKHCSGSVKLECTSYDENNEQGDSSSSLNATKHQEYHAQEDSLRKTGERVIGHSRLYERLRGIGNEYKRAFASIENIRFSHDVACASLTIPQTSIYMPFEYQQPHLIHPSTLDSLLQSVFPIFEQRCEFGAFMPTNIKELAVCAREPFNAGQELKAITRLVCHDRRSAVATINAFRVNRNAIMDSVLSITDVEFRGVGLSQLRSEDRTTMTYKVHWDMDVEFLKPHHLKLSREYSVESLEAKKDLLDSGVWYFVNKCFGQLSSESSEVLSEHNYVFEWMRSFHEMYNSQNQTETSCTDAILDRLHSAGIENEVLLLVGRELPRILRGETDTLSLLTETGLLYQLYSDESTIRCGLQLCNYLKSLVFKKPNLKVLEIGAGTGATTSVILRSLLDGLITQPIALYDFTDISPGFFHEAKTSLSEWLSFLNFHSLDIERAPCDQGFETGSYDLVIAANVLHATTSIDKTLQNVKSLLKPGGKLALIELTRFIPLLNLVFGTLPGWWKGVGEGRTSAPLLTVEQWDKALSRNGFSGINLVMHDYDSYCARNSTIISTLSASTKSNLKNHRIALLHDCDASEPCGRIADGFASSLRSRGYSTECVKWSSVEHYEDRIFLVFDCDRRNILYNSDSTRFQSATLLLTHATRILWVIERPIRGNASQGDTHHEAGLVSGLASVVRSEYQQLRLVTLDASIAESYSETSLKEYVCDICDRIITAATTDQTLEQDFKYVNQQVLIPRLLPDKKLEARIYSRSDPDAPTTSPFHSLHGPLKLEVEIPGLLSSITFVSDDIATKPLDPDEILVEVRACGVNFKDVFVALGQMKPLTQMTGEYAGIVIEVGSGVSTVQSGDRVCGFNGTPYASRARGKINNVHRVPEPMSFVEAASIPVVFATAYYSLFSVAALARGDTILIHAASGGVGQAAIMMAQLIGAEVFAIAGSHAKQVFIQQEYKIPKDHTFSSRNTKFAEKIMRLTEQRGVDVVLNSSSGDILRESWQCLATLGTFIELGKTDIYQNSQISMQPFDRNVSFVSVDMVILAERRPQEMRSILSKVFSLFDSGRLKVVKPITVMQISEIEGAFRSIQARKHIGKIVLEGTADTIVKSRLSKHTGLKLAHDATYIVAGGTGRIGKEVCRMLALRGARNIVILTRRSFEPQARSALCEEISLPEADVHFMMCEISQTEQVQKVVERCRNFLPPVRGVIQAAMVLQDRTVSRMSYSDFCIAIAPKVEGTVNLSKAFSDAPLDFFLLLSSGASLIGTRGQGNYAAGNGFQDSYAHENRATGVGPLSLNLGVLESLDGESKVLQERADFVRSEGGIPVTMDRILALIEYSMTPHAQQLGNKQMAVGFDRRSLTNATFTRIHNPIFCHLPLLESVQKEGGDDKTTSTGTVSAALKACRSTRDVEEVFCSAIAGQISKLTTLASEDISIAVPMSNFGLDSLIAVELKNWITQNLRTALQTSDILDATSIQALAGIVAQRSKLCYSEDKHAVDSDNAPRSMTRVEPPSVTDPQVDERSLPRQQLPSLAQSLEFYLDSVKPFCTEEEYENTRNAVQEFQKPNGIGIKLQQRLLDRADDPQVDNWAIPTINNNWLRNRLPVHPYQTFFASLTESSIADDQAGKAAVLVSAASEFKRRIEADELEADRMNDEPMDMQALQLIFTTHREPVEPMDQTNLYPKQDYFVIIRRGYYFKVSLLHGREAIPISWMRAVFQYVLELPLKHGVPAAFLAADERNMWSKTRELLKAVSASNKNLLSLIERAAFIVCLDEAQPSSSTERFNQYVLGDPANRWCDKPLQFIICPGGHCGVLCGQATFIGVILQQLLSIIFDTMTKYKDLDESETASCPLTEIIEKQQTFESTPSLSDQINRVRDKFQQTPRYEVVHHTHRHFGAKFLRQQHCAPNSGFEVMLQLSSLLFFGHQPPTWQSVVLRSFRNGRTDFMQIASPAMREFCLAAIAGVNSTNQRSKGDLRALFLKAATSHTGTLTRIGRGKGFMRHLEALQDVKKEDEETPALFSDSALKKMLVTKFRTSTAHFEGLDESGILLPNQEGVWVRYLVDDESCRFMAIAGEGKVQSFLDALEQAALIVKEALTNPSD